MEIPDFSKNQRSINQFSRSMQDVLQLPVLTSEDSDNTNPLKPRAESFDSKDSPKLVIKNIFELKNIEEEKNTKKKKAQFMRNLAPIERPKTTVNGNSVQLNRGALIGVNEKEKERNEKARWSLKEPNALNFSDTANNVFKTEIDFFKSEIISKFDHLSGKISSLETRLDSEHRKTVELQQKSSEMLNLFEQTSQSLKTSFEDQGFRLEQSTQFKYAKIREYFSKFGDQFKSHLRLYDKKRKETDVRLDGLEEFMKKFNMTCEKQIQEGFFQMEAKFDLFEAGKNEEFKRIFDQLRGIKEELNIHSIVHSEFQGMFELQSMAQNDSRREIMGVETQIREISNKTDLQSIFQRELENEMKIINETQADLFQEFKKHDSDLDNLNKVLQNLTSNYNIFKKVQEKETVIKSQLIDLLQDINFLKNKINSDGEMEKSMRKAQMDEIYKIIDKKFEDLKQMDEKKSNSGDGSNNEK